MQKTFVLGVGAQKAGTSWLRAYLNCFEFANFGAIKEYHVWDALYSDRAGRRPVRLSHLQKSDSQKKMKKLALQYCMQQFSGIYESYFDSLCENDVWLTGDITPAYSALDAEVFEKIRLKIERRGFNLKVVFLMRDPVERCWSNVRMRLDTIREHNPRAALSESDALHKVYRSKQCRCRTRYNDTIGELEKVFDQKQIYYGIYEEIFQEKNLGPICNFIEVPERRSELETTRNVSAKKTPLDPDVRKAVRDEYDDVYEFCFERFPQTRKLWDSAEALTIA